MAQVNVKSKDVRPSIKTHEGGQATPISEERQLRRSVMACFLWEKEFYEGGQEISTRLAELVKEVKPAVVGQIAVEARTQMKLRHAPLFLVREMARHRTHRPYVADALSKVIQRGDEMAEFLALYFSDGKQSVAHCVRDGITLAIRKFNEYELAKYDRDKSVKLRDVFRLVRPKPEGEEQAALWKRAVTGKLATPDTWEVALSSKEGGTKQEKWTRLLKEHKLGGLALLRNLRNMEQEGVDTSLIRFEILRMKTDRVLPFRFIAAAKAAPRYEAELEQALFSSVGERKLVGKTAILVDVSGSMNAPLSGKSDMQRDDAAYGVAMVGRELCETVDIYSFSDKTVLVPPRRGFALRDALKSSQAHSSTQMGAAVNEVSKHGYDRIIVITDEQAHDKVVYPTGLAKGYVINVASAKNGVGYQKWVHIDGFSEAVFSYMLETESAGL